MKETGGGGENPVPLICDPLATIMIHEIREIGHINRGRYQTIDEIEMKDELLLETGSQVIASHEPEALWVSG